MNTGVTPGAEVTSHFIMPMKRCLFFLASCALLSAPSGAAEWRALVIGNGAYPGKPLANPVNDAKLMADTLKGVGFQTTVVVDADLKTMRHAVREFGDSLRSGDVALFYYAGHGAQMKGENYLFPLDAPEEIREFEAEDACFKTALPLAAMESAGSGLNIVILDCCRNNPFARSWRAGGNAGLTELRAPQETLIAFATAPGKVALDGVNSRNSPFAKALSQQIARSERKIQDVFLDVARMVYADTKGEQRPWVSHDILTEFTFTRRPAHEATPVTINPNALLPSTNAGHDPAALARFKENLETFAAGLPKPATTAPFSAQFRYLRTLSAGLLAMSIQGLPADLQEAWQEAATHLKEVDAVVSLVPENYPLDAPDQVKRQALAELAKKHPTILTKLAGLTEIDRQLAPSLARLEKVLGKHGIHPIQVTY
jgi:hypothetical protein